MLGIKIGCVELLSKRHKKEQKYVEKCSKRNKNKLKMLRRCEIIKDFNSFALNFRKSLAAPWTDAKTAKGQMHPGQSSELEKAVGGKQILN